MRIAWCVELYTVRGDCVVVIEKFAVCVWYNNGSNELINENVLQLIILLKVTLFTTHDPSICS